MKNKKRLLERLRTDDKFAQKVFYVTFVIVLVMPWIMFAAIILTNVVLQGRFDFFNLGAEGISSWFSFWGGYIGVIITYLLTVCTIRLSFISENQAERDILDQLAFQLSELEIEKICLYNLKDTCPMEELQKFEKYEQYGGRKFLIKVIFKKPFPVYFRLSEEKKISFGKEILSDHAVISVPSCHTNGNHLEMLFLIPEHNSMSEELETFYNINYYEQATKPPEEKIKYFKIICQFENTLYANKKDGFVYTLSIDIKLNNTDTYGKTWVEPNVLDRIVAGKRKEKGSNEKD